jgi:osmotically-inducible protein OsmY
VEQAIVPVFPASKSQRLIFSLEENAMQVKKVATLAVFLLGASLAFAECGDNGLSKAAPQGTSMMLLAAKKKVTADADVQKCITDKLANSKLKDDGITAKVNGGEAVLEGSVKVSAHKGNASQIAKNCGAQKVTNNITVPSKPAPTPKPATSPKK